MTVGTSDFVDESLELSHSVDAALVDGSAAAECIVERTSIAVRIGIEVPVESAQNAKSI